MKNDLLKPADTNSTELTPRGLQRRVKRFLAGERFSFLAITTPAFEPVLEQELVVLGAEHIVKVNGGVEFDGPFELVYKANLNLRTANRVLLRVDTFKARSYPELYNKAKRIRWELYIGFADRICFSATSRTSRLHHTDNIVNAVYSGLDGYMQAIGRKVALSSEDNAAVPCIHVRFSGDTCTISLDSSGELLYRRGYRRNTAHAPLRETTAAALLRMARWDRYKVIADPLCGSGTFLLEAALMALDRAPGIKRTFAFSQWPMFNAARWEKVKQDAATREKVSLPIKLIGTDIDPTAVESACSNLKRAGLSEMVSVGAGDCLKFNVDRSIGETGLIISNLPYGKRTGSSTYIKELLGSFGAHLKQYCQGWHFGFITAESDFTRKSGLRVDSILHFKNGGLPVQFVQGKVMR